MGGIFSTHEEVDKCIQNVSRKTRKYKDVFLTSWQFSHTYTGGTFMLEIVKSKGKNLTKFTILTEK